MQTVIQVIATGRGSLRNKIMTDPLLEKKIRLHQSLGETAWASAWLGENPQCSRSSRRDQSGVARPELHIDLSRGDEAREQTELDHRRFYRLLIGASSKPDSRDSHHAAVRSPLDRDLLRLDRAKLALLLNEFCDQSGPAGLVRCTETCTGIAVEVFVK